MLEHQERKSEIHLVETVERALGHPLSPELRQAFLSAPRAHFVPFYLVQEQPGIWKRYDTTNEVYQDKALVTKINEKGHPCSSSSMPSIMAAMLEALDVSVGSRVLEIGTGTGYNAALLAEMVGPSGHVVSVDIDRELAVSASLRLKEAGYSWVQVDAANGLESSGSEQFYDRIIVTGGYPSIPHTWITQLAVEGVLVGNLLGSLATPLFRLVKQADGTMRGRLLTTSAFFMSLYGHGGSISPRVDVARFEVLPCIEQGETSIDMVHVMYDPSFCLFLESRLPCVERCLRYRGGSPKNIGTGLIWKETLLTLSPLQEEEGTSALNWRVEVQGQVPLWSVIQAQYEQWLDQGKPPVNRYLLNVSSEGIYHLLLSDN